MKSRLNKIIFVGLCFILIDKIYSQGYFLEDQIKLGVYYNDMFLDIKDSKITKGISYSLDVGYIRDIHLSDDGRWAMGIGLNYSFIEYYTNIKISTNQDKKNCCRYSFG